MMLLTACNGALDEEAAEIEAEPEDDSAVALDDDGETFEWTLQSYTIAGTEAHEMVEAWADRVEEMSAGQISFEVHPGGALVGYPEMREAVTDGVLDVGVNAPGFFVGDDPAFAAWFSMPILPFGHPELSRYMAKQWIHEWDGLELARELYAEYDQHVVGAVTTMAEPIFSTVPLESLDDFEGIQIRSAPGMEADLFRAFGAEPISMSGGEIYTALDTGVIDATEFVGFTENYGLGLHEVTDYILFPGFHTQVPIVDVTMRQDTWDELPDHLKRVLEDSILWLDRHVDQALALRDIEVAQQLEEEEGMEISELSEEEVQQVQEAAQEVTDDWGDQSEMSRRFVDSMMEYIEHVDCYGAC